MQLAHGFNQTRVVLLMSGSRRREQTSGVGVLPLPALLKVSRSSIVFFDSHNNSNVYIIHLIGGGFRDSLADMAEELCPSSSETAIPLPFFLRSPNQVFWLFSLLSLEKTWGRLHFSGPALCHVSQELTLT